MEQEFYRLNLVVEMHDRMKAALDPSRRRVKQMEDQLGRARKAAQMLDQQKVGVKADLVDHLTAKASRIGGFLRSLTGRTWKVTVGIVDRVTSSIGRIVRAVTSPLGLLGLGVGGAALGAGLVGIPLRMSGEMEQAGIAFTQMLGSAEKGIRFMNQLKSFAAKTPFEFPQVRDAAQNLLTFRFRAEEVIPMLTAIGNAAAASGKGPETIDRIVRALGQMKAKTKVTAEEMMQLTEANINGWVYLADAMGKTPAQVMKLAERGLIPADRAIKAILLGMNKDFGGMLDVQSRSLFGLASTIKDTFNLTILTKWGDGLSKAIKPRMERLVDLFTKNEDVTKRWGDTLERVAFRAGERVMGFIEHAFQVIDSLMSDPKYQTMTFFQKATVAWKEIVQTPFDNWWNSGGREWAKQAGSEIAKFMMEGFLTGVKLVAADHPWLSTLLGAYAGAKIGAVFGPIGAGVGAAAGALGGFGVSSWAKISSEERDSRQTVGLLPAHTPGIYAAPGTFWANYWQLQAYGARPLPGHALGTIATSPHVAMVAEEGPESIIPLSSRLRSRALTLWQETGRRLGVHSFALGGFTAPLAVAGAGGGSGNVVIHLHMDGAVRASIETRADQAPETVAQAAADILARTLTRILENTR
ncbi:MAG: tape measure protein [Betaproteobacteria bacterium]